MVKGEPIKYWMYPRVFNTTTYLNHTLLVNQNDTAPISISLYQSDKSIDAGIRIGNEKCFQRIVNFFDTVKVSHDVDFAGVVGEKVSLFSEILIVDRVIHERAFGIEVFGGLGLFGLLGVNPLFLG